MKSDTSVRLLCGATITHNGEPSEADATIIVKNLHGIHHTSLPDLYAAAPELLEACKDALAWTQTDLESFEEITPNEEMLQARIETLKTAISKAQGL